MAGTQVRVSETTHAMLHALAAQSGESMQEVVEKAVEQYRRKAFLEGLSEDFRALGKDAEAWKEEAQERALWDQTLADGLEQP
jgi:hypothetical protein